MTLELALIILGFGGSFGIGFLISYAIKKLLRIAAIIAGVFLAALAYLQYYGYINVNWDRIQAGVTEIVVSVANNTQIITNQVNSQIGTNSDLLGIGSVGLGFMAGVIYGFKKG